MVTPLSMGDDTLGDQSGGGIVKIDQIKAGPGPDEPLKRAFRNTLEHV